MGLRPGRSVLNGRSTSILFLKFYSSVGFVTSILFPCVYISCFSWLTFLLSDIFLLLILIFLCIFMFFIILFFSPADFGELFVK